MSPDVKGADLERPEGRPPLAVVGSQISQDEELFGRVFDRWVVGRLLGYLEPYRGRIAVAMGAVLVFTLTQLSIPLIIRSVIDDAVAAGETGRALLLGAVLLYAAVITVNYLANHLQEMCVGRLAGHLLFDLGCTRGWTGSALKTRRRTSRPARSRTSERV